MVEKPYLRYDRIKKAIIKWGYECNNNCIFCHSAELRSNPSLSTAEIKKKIDSAIRSQIKIILFSGGEPLLINEIGDIFNYAYLRGIYSGLITNGRILSDKAILHKLYSQGLRYIYMSLVSTRPHTYKKITGVDGLIESIKAIINILHLPSIMFTVNIPIIKQNAEELVDSACKIALLGVKVIKLSVIEPKGNALTNYNNVVPPLSETSNLIKTAIREIKKVSPNAYVFHDGLPYCLSLDYDKYNRDLYSENIIYMSESFEKRFFRVDYKNMSQVKGVCESCSKKGVCRGIYKGYIDANDIPLVPVIDNRIKRSKKPAISIQLNTDRNYEVNIGKLCNNSCIFCANGRISKEENRFIEFQKIRDEIIKAYKDGFRSLGFLGGEITIHPDVIRIIEFARAQGFERIAICTNGRRLSDINFARRMVDVGVTRFMISIHSHQEEIENYLNGRKNAFSEKITGIKNLISLNSKNKIRHGISLNTCIHGLNYNKLIDFIIYFKHLGINDFRFNFIRPENRVIFDRKIIPRLSNIKGSIEDLIEWNEVKGRATVAIGDIPFCLLPQSILRSKALLKKYIGELRDLDTFVTTFRSRTDPDFVDRFSWRDRKSNFLKKKSPICRSCVYDPICEGLFTNYINIYGIKELNPIKKMPD